MSTPNQEFGIISSVTEAFCSSCNRARLSAEGKLYTCLFSAIGHDLKTPIRLKLKDNDLEKIITDIWSNRNDQYSEEREQLLQKNIPRKKDEMSHISG